jgi:DNA-binding transcriptional MerR regulator
MARPRTYQIGELAARVHLSLRTLRYWEEVGLIVPSARTAGGFRLYTEENVRRVELIKRMKPVDLTLDELKSLADLRDRLIDPDLTPDERANVVGSIESFVARIRLRCEVLRARIDEAEIAVVDLERLIDDTDVTA